MKQVGNVLTGLVVLAASTVGATAALQANIEVQGRYYRAGEPVLVRIALENAGDAAVENEGGIPVIGSLELLEGDEVVKPASVPEFKPTSQPGTFLPGSSYLQVVDLAQHFPAVAKPGSYRIRFRAGELESSVVTVAIATTYDDSLDYSATMKTDFGDLTFDLLEDVAPDHVRNFVDLARRGFYDGTLFHMIVRDEMVVGGSREVGGVDYFLPPEISTQRHHRGTLSAVRVSERDNGSQFFIDLRRNPERDGNFTIFGKLVEGEEALKALEGIATSGPNYQPFYKPLKDISLNQVIIHSNRPGEKNEDVGDEAAEG
jgi:peptidyl-prolyl cis-trans isomerase B (cyclophilin B)